VPSELHSSAPVAYLALDGVIIICPAGAVRLAHSEAANWARRGFCPEGTTENSPALSVLGQRPILFCVVP
jgi:hypothetical protein